MPSGFRGSGGLSCGNCQRRKTKCDLNTPCGSCQRSALTSSCSREQVPEAYQKLLDRIKTLEEDLQKQRNNIAPSSAFRATPAVSTPAISTPAISSLSPHTVVAETTPVALANQEADAAQILEYLAWGRRKDQVFHDAEENATGPRRHSTVQDDNANRLSNSARTPQIDILEMLLPSRDQVENLVEFHEKSLVWYHGSFNAVTFRRELQMFYNLYGSLSNPNVNFQWVALLFSIMLGSITCASDRKTTSWGFHHEERAKLMQEWYKASTSCLSLGDYLETHTIYSVQAICTLTISAHLIGMSNSQSVLLATANRLAQSLGLHRLGTEDTTQSINSEQAIAQRIKRETGRRVWCQLCTQDWFSIPFSESYALDPKYFNTAKALNCNDDSVIPLPADTPSVTSYCNYLYDIAALMPQLQDGLCSANTSFMKYDQVLRHDLRMRQLATQYLPSFLSTAAPVTADLPIFTKWARRSLAICAAHKIIMIHRKLLGPSFTTSIYDITRQTCIAASKTIIREARAAVDDDGPILWIDQAFTVAAAIILSLDVYHREPDEPAYGDHKRLVEEALEYLKQFTLSKIASRGMTLLQFLLSGLDDTSTSPEDDQSSENPRKRRHDGSTSQSSKRRKTFNLSTFMRAFSDGSSPAPTIQLEVGESPTHYAWDAFTDLFPPQTGFGDSYLFGDFFDFQV